MVRVLRSPAGPFGDDGGEVHVDYAPDLIEGRHLMEAVTQLHLDDAHPSPDHQRAWWAPQSSGGSRWRVPEPAPRHERRARPAGPGRRRPRGTRATRPTHVFLVAGTVGGILPNSTRPAEFLYDNMMIHATVIHAAHMAAREEAPLPRKLVHLPARLPAAHARGGSAHRTARANKRGICHRQDRRDQAMHVLPPAIRLQLHQRHPDEHLQAPTTTSISATRHVLPALIRRFYEAARRGDRAVTVWGTGSPRREFLHTDDLADACLFLMRYYEDATHINVGTGVDGSIRDLAGHDSPRRRPGVGLSSTRLSLTACHASSLTCRRSTRLAGKRRSTLRRASGRPWLGSPSTTMRPQRRRTRVPLALEERRRALITGTTVLTARTSPSAALEGYEVSG